MKHPEYFAVVVHGAPSVRYAKTHVTLADAIATADRVRGTGTCTTARVMRCATRSLARTADISRRRVGETFAYGF